MPAILGKIGVFLDGVGILRKAGNNMETVKFIDPETNETIEFVVEEETMLNGVKYLLVSEEVENGDFEAYILKEIRTEDEDVIYEFVEDDIELDAIARVFGEMLDEDVKLEQ